MDWLASAMGISDPEQVKQPERAAEAPETTESKDAAALAQVQAQQTAALDDASEPIARAPVAADITRPEELQSTGQLTADQLLRHFETFKETIANESSERRLRAAHMNPDKDIAAEAETIRKECFDQIGIDGIFGIASFRTLKRDYKTNAAVLLAFQESLELESLAMDKAELPPDEYALRQSKYQSLKSQQDLIVGMMPQLKGLLDNSAQASLLQARMEERRRQRGLPENESAEAIMARGIQKLAFVRQQIATNGLDEKALFGQAMQLLQDPSYLNVSSQEHVASQPTSAAMPTDALNTSLQELSMNDVGPERKSKDN
eukprot:TRINITY_DN12347_c2_g1_i1.p1 TRINITY_DN12347_c2_g1~~TRINITY_DN12347_c2_g1_i1.p1  ORF type:complete len:318 (+),score=85.53 TRINITY_DN12347_c2_g1_i1:201-1154(+)